MASVRVCALLIVVVIAFSLTNHEIDIGIIFFRFSCIMKMWFDYNNYISMYRSTTIQNEVYKSCCKGIDCGVLCKGSKGVCKPDEACNRKGGLCCCVS